MIISIVKNLSYNSKDNTNLKNIEHKYNQTKNEKSKHKRSSSLHNYFICMDYNIYDILTTINYNEYLIILKVYYNDKHKIPDEFELYSITPNIFELIHKSINVSITLEIYKLFVDVLNQQQFKQQICKIFEFTEKQLMHIIDYIDYLASDEHITRCKKAFINSISKNTFRMIENKYLHIIIDRIEFSPTEFRKFINNDNKYVIYSSGNLHEIYLSRYKQKPRKHKDEIEYICINEFVYRIDNLF